MSPSMARWKLGAVGFYSGADVAGQKPLAYLSCYRYPSCQLLLAAQATDVDHGMVIQKIQVDMKCWFMFRFHNSVQSA